MSETDRVLRADAAREAVRNVMRTHVMFSVLPAAEQRMVEALITARRYERGEHIAAQGDPTTEMFIIHGGLVRLKQDDGAKYASIGLLGEGSTLGETALVDDRTWPHDVIAEETTILLSLPIDKTRALAARSPVVDDHFKKVVGRIKIAERLRVILGDARYSPEQFADILAKLGVKRIREGNAVFNQGDHDPRLYCVESGAVDLVRTPLAGDPITLTRVGRGQIIGEGAAFVYPPIDGRRPFGATAGEAAGDGTHPVTARAVAETTVLVIYPPEVQRIVGINPTLEETLRSRLWELDRVAADELRTRDRVEGVDQRVELAKGVTEDEFRAVDKDVGKAAVKLPVVRQDHESECAAACLTSVANHYGKTFTLGQMKELTGLDVTPVTPDQIIRGAETLGFRAKGYSLTFAELRGLRLPAIIGWQGYHYATLYRVSDREVELVDPAAGIRKIKTDEFVKSWTAATVAGVESDRADAGVVVALEPTVAFEKEEKPKSSIGHFVSYILPHKKYYAEAILAAVAINLLGMASPLFVQTIVDTVVVHKDAALLNTMLAGMVLVAVLTTLMSVAQSLLLAHTTARLDMRMMSEFYRHVLSLPMDFFMKRNKGEILARFGENQKIRAILTGSTITVLMNSLMIVLYFMMMLAYNPLLTGLFAAFIPIYISIVVYFTPRIKAIAQEIFLTNSQSQSYLIESLNSIESLKATSNEYFARARWEGAFVENVNRSFKQQRLGLTSNSLFKLATLGSTIVILWQGASAVMAGTMTIGELMGFNMLMGLVTGPVMQMVDLWNQLQEVRIAVDRVGDVLNVKPESEAISSPSLIRTRLKDVEGRIEFRKVNFGYDNNNQKTFIMRDFDLTIEPGQRIAFVGPAGCGKSTVAKMLLGFYRPQSGQILIDGKDIAEMDLDSLRRNVGVVLQDTFLFGGTVAENIALGDPEPDMQAVRDAARKAHAEEFILQKQLGYQTPIGEKGVGLSGGQRQRIGIARALYRRPKIMIFDEATSALDNETEKLVIDDLKPILKSRTSFSIAHRLTTIVDSDAICYIRDGKVQEKGSHLELTDRHYLIENNYKGLYYDLARQAFNLPPLEL